MNEGRRSRFCARGAKQHRHRQRGGPQATDERPAVGKLLVHLCLDPLQQQRSRHAAQNR
jgi:hypothetical protein